MPVGVSRCRLTPRVVSALVTCRYGLSWRHTHRRTGPTGPTGPTNVPPPRLRRPLRLSRTGVARHTPGAFFLGGECGSAGVKLCRCAGGRQPLVRLSSPGAPIFSRGPVGRRADRTMLFKVTAPACSRATRSRPAGRVTGWVVLWRAYLDCCGLLCRGCRA